MFRDQFTKHICTVGYLQVDFIRGWLKMVLVKSTYQNLEELDVFWIKPSPLQYSAPNIYGLFYLSSRLHGTLITNFRFT